MKKANPKTKRKKKYSKKIGLPPGTLVYVGKDTEQNSSFDLIEYLNEEYVQKEISSINEIEPCVDNHLNSWINLIGLSNIETISQTGKIFNLHPLLLEDVLNTDHRPKVEEYESQLFCVLKMIKHNAETNQIEIEQVSLVLGKNYLLSFQERKGDVFEPVRQRIKTGKGLARGKKADYLLYMLIDIIVDNYYVVLEYISERVEELEDEIFNGTKPEQLEEVSKMKKQLIMLRKNLSPLREFISGIINSQNGLIDEKNRPYFQDIHDHVIQLIENLETYREWNNELKDAYLSALSHQMNQVMQVLTIIATIFIPLTFIAGIYGMNFDNMPELHYKYGYQMVWGLMIFVFILMLIYFKRKKWL